MKITASLLAILALSTLFSYSQTDRELQWTRFEHRKYLPTVQREDPLDQPRKFYRRTWKGGHGGAGQWHRQRRRP